MNEQNNGNGSRHARTISVQRRSIFKRWYFWVAAVAVVLIVIVLISKRSENRANDSTTDGQAQNQTVESQNVEGQKVGNQETEADKEVKFTHQLFDPAKASNIVPLGELNGGYIETQPITGIMVNIKKDASGNPELMEIYAPTDMTLEDYSHASDPLAPNRPLQWQMGFRISKDMKMTFHHLSWVTDAIKEVTPETLNSGSVPPTKKLSFKAGDLIARTTGTKEASNWNIYLRDDKKTNTFVNQARYDKVREMYGFVNAACPFDYYDEPQKNQYLALMGHYKAGQSKT